MKNIRLIAFLFGLWFAAAVPLCVFAESIELNGSAKVVLPFMELRGAVEKSKWNYGASFSTKHWFSNAPVTFKLGNLSAGGSLSKLNSPAIYSSVSPFSSSSLRGARTGLSV